MLPTTTKPYEQLPVYGILLPYTLVMEIQIIEII